jgi:hypothetical protein
MPAPVQGYRSRLLSTRAQDVSPDVTLRFREVCAAVSAVEAGYACRQRITIDGDVYEERLGLAVHLGSRSRSHDAQMDVMRAYAQAFPGDGLAFLEDVAVPAWRKLGVQVY